MIRATTALLDYLRPNNPRQEWSVISAYANIIEELGGEEDAEAVGQYLLENQGHYFISPLYDVILKWGNKSLAEKFFQKAVADAKLRPGFDLEILEILGKSQLEAARPMLVEYSLGDLDYYTNAHAVRGLLNYNCEDLQDRIRTAIESIYNKNLFNELMPALVCKLKDRGEVLENLYVTGKEHCSTDCNAGILLGFSLCGSEGFSYFKKAIFDPAWEAYYPPRHYVVEGMRNLGITFWELFQEVENMEDPEKQKYGIQLLLSLLKVKIKDIKMEKYARESYSDLMHNFFSLKPGQFSGSLIELAEKFGTAEEARALEELLRLRLREETLYRCL